MYRQRAASIEPVFAQIKHNRGFRSFARRGVAAADSEWKLIAASHNLLGISPLGGHGVMTLEGTAVPTRAVRRGRGCCAIASCCTS
ncbi:MAG: transposase [Acidimicrobiia bacterium]